MIKLKIVTPLGVIYEDNEIEMITIPTQAGIVGIKEDHVPLISPIVAGEINIQKGDHTVDLAVSKGILEVRRGSEINILADTAERAEHIDLERAEEARKRAEEYLKQKEDIEDVEFAAIQARIEKELARVNLARKYRKIKI